MTIAATSQSGGKLYRSVVETLRREIEAGRFAESQLLPGERALCELLEVSRTTLRKAIAELIAEGVLFHRHGAGTFIHRATPRHSGSGSCRTHANLHESTVPAGQLQLRR